MSPTAAVPVAALLTAVALTLACAPSGAATLRWRLGLSAGGGGSPAGGLRGGRRARSGFLAGRSPAAPAAAVCAAALVVTGVSGVLLAVAAGVAAGAAAWLGGLALRRRASDERRRHSTEACDALVAELLAGRPAGGALDRVARDHPVLAPAARACDLGGDVPTALRDGGLPTLAAAWQVAEECGCGLAPTLQRMADGLRAEEATRAEVTSALAPVRATARLLAVLPVFGLLLGSGLGGDPIQMLLGSPAGHALLLGGVLLALAGTVWVEGIADGVEAS